MKFMPIILAGVLASLAHADEAAIRQAFAERYPHVAIKSVAVTAIPGLYEVFAGGQIVYADERGDYLLKGPLLDTREKLNVTERRLEVLKAVKFDTLPFEQSIAIKQGRGERRIAVFADPDCPFCRQLEKELARMDNLTVHVFLLPLAELEEARALDAHTVRLTFSGRQSSQTLLTVATMPIVSKAYYTANDFEAARMVPPLGSGPYKIGRVAAGQTIEYERVPDYWGRDLAVNRGQYNFDRIRIDFYRDRQAAFEAFKKGDTHFREEFTARVWASDYDFPALAQGKVVKREFEGEKWPSMQSIALNQRRAQFRDVRVRRAIAMCFDFEWTRRTLFAGSYQRSQSNFEKSEFRAEGLPTPGELALLEPFRAELPPETFGEPPVQPVSDGSGRDRKLLGAASRLLAEAGWKRSGDFVVNGKGERLEAEMLANDDSLARIFLPWVENMKAIGIDASVRVVDSAQYEARLDDFDFDLDMAAISIGATPTVDALEAIYHSRAADRPGTRNYPGTKSPAIDALVAAAGRSQSREELVVALRALDRVLRARLDWIPTYYLANHRVAYWDMFGFKEPKPDYGFPVETLWWFDSSRAQKIGRG